MSTCRPLHCGLAVDEFAIFCVFVILHSSKYFKQTTMNNSRHVACYLLTRYTAHRRYNIVLYGNGAMATGTCCLDLARIFRLIQKPSSYIR